MEFPARAGLSTKRCDHPVEPADSKRYGLQRLNITIYEGTPEEIDYLAAAQIIDWIEADIKVPYQENCRRWSQSERDWLGANQARVDALRRYLRQQHPAQEKTGWLVACWQRIRRRLSCCRRKKPAALFKP